jgi:hypothetical protein
MTGATAGTAPEKVIPSDGRSSTAWMVQDRPVHCAVDASTERKANPNALLETVSSLFHVAREEYFEDGMDTAFSRDLISLVKREGHLAVEVISRLVLGGNAEPAVIAEALRWIGRIEDFPSLAQRLWLLERCLANTDPQIRDGAILGLASFDDPRAMPYVQEALRREGYPEIRLDLEHLIAQLHVTKQCHWF